jgi:hypothetical protein
MILPLIATKPFVGPPARDTSQNHPLLQIAELSRRRSHQIISNGRQLHVIDIDIYPNSPTANSWMSSSIVDILLTWCNENGIKIDPRIQVVESTNHQEVTDCTYPLSGGECFCSSSRNHGISVYSLEDHVDCSCVRECSVC